ncbi:MAG: hypothetical protein VB875_13965 [Pirellulales bacterium]
MKEYSVPIDHWIPVLGGFDGVTPGYLVGGVGRGAITRPFGERPGFGLYIGDVLRIGLGFEIRSLPFGDLVWGNDLG